jgi:hypothetical protein
MRREYGGAVPRARLSVALGGSTGDLTIHGDDLTGWPVGADPFFIIIARGKVNEEKILVQSRTGNIMSVWTDGITTGRGADGTTITTHEMNEYVEHVFTATDADEANEHVNEGTGAHGYPPITDIVLDADLAAHEADTSTHGVAEIVGRTETQTLTNKTISGAANTLSNIPESAVTGLVADLAASAYPTQTGNAGKVLGTDGSAVSWTAPVAGPQGDPGDTGPQGDPGDPGADGATILSGTAAPTTEGVDGDYYFRTTTGMFYGPKASGSWPSGTSLVGPTGATGATGATGSTGAAGQGVPTGGSTNQVLAKNSGMNYDTAWVTPSDDIPKSLVDAKGDLIVATADNTVTRVAVGSAGQVLTASAGATAGVAWATPSGGSTPGTVSGGTVTTDGAYTYRTFSASATLSASAGDMQCEALIIAAGGGGAGNSSGGGGGGGAGQLVIVPFTLRSGDSLSVLIGAAGSGGSTSGTSGTNGGDSYIGTDPRLRARGGGGGGGVTTQGKAGGCGGGGGQHGSDGYTIDGGAGAGFAGPGGPMGGTGRSGSGYRVAGGGGGMRGHGLSAMGNTKPNGGDGVTVSELAGWNTVAALSGVTYVCVGGGGGGNNVGGQDGGDTGQTGGGSGSRTTGSAGSAFGCGGGGGGWTGYAGGAGYAGLVIVRHLT